MSRRRRVGVGVLLSIAVAMLTLATFLGRNAMSLAAGVTCLLALAWAYILVQDAREASGR